MQRTLIIAVLLICNICISPHKTVAETNSILSTGSYWRSYISWRSPVVAGEDKAIGVFADIQTSPPPALWAQPDFNDSDWIRSKGPFPGNEFISEAGPNLATVFLRGHFEITNPAAVKDITLSLSYRGATAVFVNGKLLGKKDFPEGKIKMDTPGLPYPKEAYVNSKGISFPVKEGALVRYLKKHPEYKPVIAGRTRKIENVIIPRKLLRTGINIIGIEIHASNFQPEAKKWSKKKPVSGWAHFGLYDFSLSTTGTGITPNIERPDKLQVWNVDIHRIVGQRDYGDITETVKPIDLVGVKNGYYSAQIVVGAQKAIENLKVTMSSLKAGTKSIPSESCIIRYGSLSKLTSRTNHDGLDPSKHPSYTHIPAFGGLSDKAPTIIKPLALTAVPAAMAALGLPPKEAPSATQPIWLTVYIPRDTAKGVYQGNLTVSAKGLSLTTIPVSLEVINYTLPDPKDMEVFVGLSQSPETLAKKYNVPLWSDKHWEIMEESWKLLGGIGNNLLVIPLLTQTQYGNDKSMVPLIKQSDGTYKYDFTILDQLTKLALKYCRLDRVSLQVVNTGIGWKQAAPDRERFITVKDAKTDATTSILLPDYGSKEGTDIMQPFMNAVINQLSSLGVEKDSIIIGTGQDSGISKEIIAFFANITPGVKWHYGAHNRPRLPYLAYAEYLYVPISIRSYDDPKRKKWWDTDPDNIIIAMSQRIHDHLQGPMMVRTMLERSIMLGDYGIGRICLDYWPVDGGNSVGHSRGTYYSKWHNSSAQQRTPHFKWMALPGEKGPIPSIKLELLREGNQETAARMKIECALTDNKLTAKQKKLAIKLLSERHAIGQIWQGNKNPVRAKIGKGWQQRSAELYRLAGDIK